MAKFRIIQHNYDPPMIEHGKSWLTVGQYAAMRRVQTLDVWALIVEQAMVEWSYAKDLYDAIPSDMGAKKKNAWTHARIAEGIYKRRKMLADDAVREFDPAVDIKQYPALRVPVAEVERRLSVPQSFPAWDYRSKEYGEAKDKRNNGPFHPWPQPKKKLIPWHKR